MNSQELRALQQAYSQVYAPQELDEAEVLAQKGGVSGSVKVNKTREGGFLGIGSKEVSKPVPGSFSPKDVSSKDAARYNTGIDKKFGSSDNIDNTSAANVQHAARSSGNSGYMKVKDPGSLPNTGIPNRPTPGRASDQNRAREMGSDIVRMNRYNRVREGSFDNLIDTGASVIKKPVQDYANKKIGGLSGTLGIPGAVAGQKVDQTASDLKKGNYGKALNTVVSGVRTLTQSYDLYDVILSHLLDEGYADTEESATAIMVNMSEEWRESIVEMSDFAAGGGNAKMAKTGMSKDKVIALGKKNLAAKPSSPSNSSSGGSSSSGGVTPGDYNLNINFGPKKEPKQQSEPYTPPRSLTRKPYGPDTAKSIFQKPSYDTPSFADMKDDQMRSQAQDSDEWLVRAGKQKPGYKGTQDIANKTIAKQRAYYGQK
jgi:hypothetical protein